MGEILKTFDVNLDLKRVTAQASAIPPLVEGDNGNVFVITLTDGGIPVDLSGHLVVVVFSKVSDGKTVEQDTEEGSVTIGGEHNNEITVRVKTGSFGAGKNNCEVQIYSGSTRGTLSTSAQFNFDGRKGIVNSDTVAASDEYPILVELIERVEELSTHVGDMTKAEYDQNGDGVVDKAAQAKQAEDAEKLGGNAPTYYATAEGLTAANRAISKEETERKAAFENLTPADIGAAALNDSGVISGAQSYSPLVEVAEAERTLQTSDAGCTLLTRNKNDSSQNFAISIPSNADVPLSIGTEIAILRYAAGTVTISHDTAVGLYFAGKENLSAKSNIQISNRFGMIALKKVFGNSWLITGDFEEV